MVFVRKLETEDSELHEKDEEETIYMDEDPVYSYGFGSLVSCVFLIQFKSRIISVLRRLLFVFSLWFVSSGAFILRWYPRLDRTESSLFVPLYFARLLGLTSELKFSSYHGAFLVSLPPALIHILLLLPVILSSRSLSDIMAWHESDTKLGKHMVRHLNQRNNRRKNSISLAENLRTRVRYLAHREFWKYMFEKFLCPIPPIYLRHFPLKVFIYIVKMPVVLVCSLFLTLPIFTVSIGVIHKAGFIKLWARMFRNKTEDKEPRTEVQSEEVKVSVEAVKAGDLSCKNGTPKLPGGRRYKCLYCLHCFLMCASYLLSLYLCLFFFTIISEFVVLILIDVVRTLQHSLRIIIFVVSIFHFLRQMMGEFTDNYRQLKIITFKVLLDMTGAEYIDTVKQVQVGPVERGPLIFLEGGQIGLKKHVFDHVVSELLPYRKCLRRMLLKIFLFVCSVSLLWWIVIDFQVSTFCQFSSKFLLDTLNHVVLQRHGHDSFGKVRVLEIAGLQITLTSV